MKKLNVTYRIERGNESAEVVIALPISEERYVQLAQGLAPDNAVWEEVRTALNAIATLQGYRLGAWGIDIEIYN